MVEPNAHDASMQSSIESAVSMWDNNAKNSSHAVQRHRGKDIHHDHTFRTPSEQKKMRREFKRSAEQRAVEGGRKATTAELYNSQTFYTDFKKFLIFSSKVITAAYTETKRAIRLQRARSAAWRRQRAMRRSEAQTGTLLPFESVIPTAVTSRVNRAISTVEHLFDTTAEAIDKTVDATAMARAAIAVPTSLD